MASPDNYLGQKKRPLFCQKEAVFLKRHSLYGNNSSSNNGRHFKDNHLEKET